MKIVLTNRRIVVLGLVGLLLLAGFFYLTFFLRFVRVPTGAMKNTILPGERLVVNVLGGDIARGDLIIFKFPVDPSTLFLKRVIALPGETVRLDLKESKVLINGEELAEQRVFVEPDENDANALKTSPDTRATTSGQWAVYYFDAALRFFGEASDDFGADYAVRDPYRVPKKGDFVSERIKNDLKARKVYDADGDEKYDSDQYFCLGDNRDNSEDSRYWGTVPRTFITGKPFLVYWSEGPNGARWDRIFSRVK
jgi:signal peptidase I